MGKKIFFIGVLFLTIATYNQAQTDNEFMSLVKSYTVESVPFCVEYSDDIISNIENNSFDVNQGWGEYPGEEPENDILVREFFFEGKSDVHLQNIWTRDTVEVQPIDSYLKYKRVYASNVIIKDQKFIGIVFCIDDLSGSEMYFCTFTKKGELISKILFAFYVRSGSYTTGDGGRVPFYAERTGCINNDYSISIDVGPDENQKYKIQTNGKIIEIK